MYDDKKILIISGGKAEDGLISDLIRKNHYSMIIAADSGLNSADRLNLKLDFIVGDFDSVEPAVLQKYKELSTPIETFPTEKDKSDTQIAIELALMHNPSQIDITAATGSRIDHMLANIHLLMLPMQLGIKACILDINNRIYLKNESFVIKMTEQYGKYISLLPFTEKVRGLTLKGFKYPLDNVILTAGSSLCISNEILDEEARILMTEGILLVMETMD
jgi:thiamine pyrophosphokinase